MSEGNWESREADRDRLERHLDHECKKRGISRRDLMKGGMATAAALGLGTLFAACGGDDDSSSEPAPAPSEPAPAEPSEPAAPAEEPAAPPAEAVEAFTGTLNVTGLGVDLIEPIKEIAERDLGFSLAFDVTDTITSQQKILTQPESVDVWSGYAHEYDRIWPSGNLMPIETSQITEWAKISNIHKLGKLDPASTVCQYGAGDAFFRQMYVDPDKTGQWPSSPEVAEELQGEAIQWVDETTGETIGPEPGFIKGVPQNFNMDSVGYNQDVIPDEPENVSWGELFNEAYQGQVALLADPSIAYQDAGNAAKALGLMEFGTLGNMTRDEIDALTTILLDLKSKGHFRALWTTFDESVNLMASGEVVIESMWSPAVALLVIQGVNVRYAAPPEGFRGWGALTGIPSHVADDPSKMDAVLRYVNWWHSGEPGAIMMRQGYYNAVQENTRAFAEPEEWDYWFGGQPAAKDLPGLTGQVGDVKAGQVRDGGSFEDRGCVYSSWNSQFAEAEYQVERFNEFQAA